MSKLSDLKRIASSLTKTEKRYISVNFNRSIGSDASRNSLNLLFTEINNLIKEAQKENQTLENEKAFFSKEIEKKKKKHPDIYSTITTIKLTDFIFESLRQYNAKEIEYKIGNTLQTIRLLISKSLYDLAVEQIEKIRKEIPENEFGEIYKLELLFLERNILTRSNNNLKKMAPVRKNMRKVEVNLSATIDTTIDNDKMLEILRQSGEFPGKLELSKTTLSILDNPINALLLPYEAARRGLNTAALHKAYIEKKPKESIVFLEQLTDRTKKKSLEDPDCIIHYYQALIRLSNGVIQAGEIAKLNQYIPDVLQVLLDRYPAVKSQSSKFSSIILNEASTDVDFNFLNLLINYLLITQNFNEAEMLSHQNETITKTAPKRIRDSIRLVLLTNYTYAYFLSNNYRDALHCIEFIKNYEGTENRKDIKAINQSIEILIDFEKNNFRKENPLAIEDIKFKISDLLAYLGRELKEPTYFDTKNIIQQILSILFSFFSLNKTKKWLREELSLLEDDNNLQNIFYQIWKRRTIDRLSE